MKYSILVMLISSSRIFAQNPVSYQFSEISYHQFVSCGYVNYLVINPQIKKQLGKLIIPIAGKKKKIFVDDGEFEEYEYLGDIKGTKVALVELKETNAEYFYAIPFQSLIIPSGSSSLDSHEGRTRCLHAASRDPTIVGKLRAANRKFFEPFLNGFNIGCRFKCLIFLNLNMPLDHEHELIEITDGNIEGLHSLIGESMRDGYNFLQRTIDDWYSGANKFDRQGEKLYGLFTGKDLIGVGGLNIDPYSLTAKAGRVRHLYIRKANRRAGYATLIMNKILKEACYNFTVLRLFTDNAGASAFYEKLGFNRTGEYKASHFMALPIIDENADNS